MERQTTPGPPARLYRFLLAVVALAQLAPVLLVHYVPLVDLPNHASRLEILAHYGSNPTMQRWYTVDWRPIPDLAFDLVGVPLVRLGLSPLAATRLFLVVTVLLYVAGGHLVASALHGRRSWAGVVLPLVLYDSMLLLGFLNFVFGFGVFLVAFGLWYRRRAALTPGWGALLALLAAVTLLSHLAAYGLLLVAAAVVLCVDLLARRLTRRAALASALVAVPSLVLLLYATTQRGGRGGADWGSAKEKAKPVFGLFLTYDRRVDALLLGALLVVLAAAVLLARRRTIVVPAAALAAVFALLYLVLPHAFVTATDVDSRMLPAVVVTALCALRLSLPPRLAAGLAVAAVALGVARLAYVTHEWRLIGGAIDRQVALLDRSLPRNADVYSVFPEGASSIARDERGYAHIVSYAAIDRNAHVSRTFAERSQQPLVARRPEPYDLDLRALRSYGYVWTYRPGALVRRELRGRCATVYDEDGFYLCRVVR